MTKTEQLLENQKLGDYSEKIEKARKLYQLFNNITFGSEEDSAESREILKQVM